MMRLKPSVCSRSASAAALFVSMLCTIADIPLSPRSFLDRVRRLLFVVRSARPWFVKRGRGLLKQLLPVRFDISGKAERVIACALFRKLGIAIFERFDDSQMLRQ